MVLRRYFCRSKITSRATAQNEILPAFELVPCGTVPDVLCRVVLEKLVKTDSMVLVCFFHSITLVNYDALYIYMFFFQSFCHYQILARSLFNGELLFVLPRR